MFLIKKASRCSEGFGYFAFDSFVSSYFMQNLPLPLPVVVVVVEVVPVLKYINRYLRPQK
ncbi:MAG TPA: hypothetical protein PK939_07250 [Bacteroidales bacterium]|nr:hypothetical protein [Bacteroidales bacterium]